MAHLRWWAEKVGKAGILPADNTKLGIPERRYVTGENKAKELGDRLNRITDPHVRMSLRLQEAFGLRREESIKFQPRYADRTDRSEEHTSELQSLMRISYAVFCLKKNKTQKHTITTTCNNT